MLAVALPPNPCELTPQHSLQLDTSRGLKGHEHSANTRELNERLRRRSAKHYGDRVEAGMAGRDGVATRSRFNRRFSRYSNLNSRFADLPEMWNCGQTRYAPMHVPGHVAHAMRRAPKVRQRFPTVRRSPSHPHPWLRPYSHAGTLKRAGRSQRPAFLLGLDRRARTPERTAGATSKP
jgi:hypothetical protein